MTDSRKHRVVECSDCPPVGYPTDETRCLPCPRRAALLARAQGAGLVEIGTGRTAFDYGAEWMADTIRMLANERRGGELGSSEVGKKGQKASLKARRKGQRPWAQCEAIWADKSHRDTAAAVAAINEGFKPRSKTALYNRLGKRNVAAGRRS